METILLGYCVVCYIVVAAILFTSRHEIVMVHYRNPLKYSMERISLTCLALLLFAPLSLYWVLYEVWDDKVKNS